MSTYEDLERFEALEECLALQILEDSGLKPLKLQFPRRRNLLSEAKLRKVLRKILLFAVHRQGSPLRKENEKLVKVFDEVICYLNHS